MSSAAAHATSTSTTSNNVSSESVNTTPLLTVTDKNSDQLVVLTSNEEHDIDGEEIQEIERKEGEQDPKLSSSSSEALQLLSLALQQTTSCTSCGNLLSLEDDDIGDVVQELLKDLKKEGKSRSTALQKLYRMTDRERQHNRMPMICTTKFNAIRALIPCLSVDTSSSNSDRRRALLLIANLAIPTENKAVILLTETIDDLLPALLRIIRTRQNESYLAAVCLFNLSYLEDAKMKLLTYVAVDLERDDTPALSYEFHRPEDNPSSLLRILESLLLEYTGFVASPSVQREAVHWSMATLRNLVTIRDNAILVGTKTRIPSLAVTCLQVTDRELSHWSPDSLEDASLMLLAHITMQPECTSTLQRLLTELRKAFAKIQGKGGIHEVRANAILSHLQVSDQDEQPEGDPSKDESAVMAVTTSVI